MADLPIAYNGCRCICHRQAGVKHFFACCGPHSPIAQPTSAARDEVAGLIAMLKAVTREEGLEIFEHSAEDIGLEVMEHHKAILAALTSEATQRMANRQEKG